jgi:hypothetical protein
MPLIVSIKVNWVNLLNHTILSVIESQITIYFFDSYICLIDYLVDTWTCEGYYYLEIPLKLLKFEDVKRIKAEYDHIIQGRITYALDNQGDGEYDTSDEYRELNTY